MPLVINQKLPPKRGIEEQSRIGNLDTILRT